MDTVNQRLERLENIALATLFKGRPMISAWESQRVGYEILARAIIDRYEFDYGLVEVFARYKVTSLADIELIPDRSLQMGRGVGKKKVEKLRTKLAVLRMAGHINMCHDGWHYYEAALEICRCKELWPVKGE